MAHHFSARCAGCCKSIDPLRQTRLSVAATTGGVAQEFGVQGALARALPFPVAAASEKGRAARLPTFACVLTAPATISTVWRNLDCVI